MPLRRERPATLAFEAARAAPLSGDACYAAAALLRTASALLGGRPYLFEAWSIADTDLAMMLHRMIGAGDEVPDALREYAAAQWRRPAIRQWIELRL